MPTQVIMPQLGESVVEGTVTKWLKQKGDRIEEFEALLEVNTDKVDSEIPSPAAGVVLKILVPEGQTVRAGTVIAWIGQPGERVEGGQPADEQRADQSVPTVAEASSPVVTLQAGRDRDLGFISPVVARLAREQKVDLSLVKGTGEGGRITKKDVLAYLAQRDQATAATPAAWETPGEGDLFRPTELMFANASAPEAVPQPVTISQPVSKSQVPATRTEPVAPGDRILPLTTMRRAIAERMVLSKHTAAHVTTVMEADMSRVSAHRAAHKAEFAQAGVHLTFTAYFVAATVAALRAVPLVNSSWTDDGLILHGGIHIGLAASLGEEGLIVPVIRNADGLSLLGLARTINDLAERARTRRLQPDEVKGGTFTITNHGVGGSLFASPVINYPQCGILGVGAIKKRAVVIEGDAIAVRPMVYLTLTFDHRILDGAGGDAFLGKVVQVLEEWA
jgi:2-oxoglutarate dehydrogenase E2 component (dihydrolipoamide succinyltransferase)